MLGRFVSAWAGVTGGLYFLGGFLFITQRLGLEPAEASPELSHCRSGGNKDHLSASKVF